MRHFIAKVIMMLLEQLHLICVTIALTLSVALTTLVQCFSNIHPKTQMSYMQNINYNKHVRLQIFVVLCA